MSTNKYIYTNYLDWNMRRKQQNLCSSLGNGKSDVELKSRFIVQSSGGESEHETTP